MNSSDLYDKTKGFILRDWNKSILFYLRLDFRFITISFSNFEVSFVFFLILSARNLENK